MSIDSVFLKLVNMSIAAGWMILAIVLLRLILKKAPRWIFCILWALVAVRLICPFSFESALSLIPSSETIPEEFLYYDAARGHTTARVDVVDNPVFSQDISIPVESPVSFVQTEVMLLSLCWIVGLATLLLYALISFILLRRSVRASVLLRNNIFYCDDIKSPFILGIFKPMIYIPSSLTGETLESVLAHETAHIRRHDHWWKPLGYLLLTVYWFNPLCWLAYILLCRDIEMACDEKVIRDMDNGAKAAYSQALLNCSFPRKRIAACPLAFGEVGVKERVKSVLNYKKPAFWIIIVALAACGVATVCFLTDPVPQNTLVMGSDYSASYVYPFNESNASTSEQLPQYCITAGYHLYSGPNDGTGSTDWTYLGKLTPYDLTTEELAGYMDITDKQTRKLIKKITDAYILRVSENYFYLVFQTKDEKTYLAYGLEDVAERGQDYSDDTVLYGIYRLESTFREGIVKVDFFRRSLESIVGSPVYNFSNFESGKIRGYHIAGFKYGDTMDYSQMNNLGFAVFQTNGTGYRLIDIKLYENAALTENGIVLCPDPAVADTNGEIRDDNTFDIIMVLNDDADRIERIYSKDGKQEKVYTDGPLQTPFMSVWPWEYDKGCDTVSLFVYDKSGNEIAFDSAIPQAYLNNGLPKATEDCSVRITEEISTTEDSCYSISANLQSTDFSSVGQVLADKIAQDWARYDGMTLEQRMVSSHMPGWVSLGFDNWKDCEQAIGFSVDNPLESLDWLNKTDYFGSESSNPDIPVHFIQVNAIATNPERKLQEINIESGYSVGNAHITLTSTLYNGAGKYGLRFGYSGYATYEKDTVLTGSGIPVLMVETCGTNNTGFYNNVFSDVSAFWVQGNVLYNLRVFGDIKDKDEIQDVLDKIIVEI